MGFFNSLFGPSKDEIWTQLAEDIGGDYIDGGFWSKDVLRYQHEDWEILLDTYTQSSGTGKNRRSTTYTRMRAPFRNPGNFYFEVYQASLFSGLGKVFGMQDIEVGDSFFDEEFILKSNDPEGLKLLLEDQRLKMLIQAQPSIDLKVRDDEGFFGQSFPEGVDEIYFSCRGTITDTGTLRDLFELFCQTLQRLAQIDEQCVGCPGIRLRK